MADLQSRQTFDKDRNGEVSEDEARVSSSEDCPFNMLSVLNKGNIMCQVFNWFYIPVFTKKFQPNIPYDFCCTSSIEPSIIFDHIFWNNIGIGLKFAAFQRLKETYYICVVHGHSQ